MGSGMGCGEGYKGTGADVGEVEDVAGAIALGRCGDHGGESEAQGLEWD